MGDKPLSGTFALLLALASAGLSAALWLLIIRRSDRLEPEPLGTLLYALAGGVLAVFFGLLFSLSGLMFLGIETIGQVRDPGLLVLGCLAIGLGEEMGKAGACAILLGRHRDFNEPPDGIIYAMVVSLGFAAVENVFYLLKHGLSLIVARSLISVPGHLVFGAIWGYGLARAKFGQRHKGDLLLPTLPWVLAAGLAHAAYDFLVLLGLGTAWLILPFLAVLVRRGLLRLRAISPFRLPGQCPKCLALVGREEGQCPKCGADLRRG